MTSQREARPQRFSSLVAKYALQYLSSDTSNSNFSESADEYSTYGGESFGRESDIDDADIKMGTHHSIQLQYSNKTLTFYIDNVCFGPVFRPD